MIRSSVADPRYHFLYAKHSWLYAQAPSDASSSPIDIDNGLGVGPGWLALVDRMLMQIAGVVRRMSARHRKEYALLWVRRKDGLLDVAERGGNEETAFIIQDAKSQSERACEACCNPGETWEVGVLRFTFCELCARRRARNESVSARKATHATECAAHP